MQLGRSFKRAFRAGRCNVREGRAPAHAPGLAHTCWILCVEAARL